ncbi:hypothetical protein [Nitratireductor indicus]|uniref:hypothetical protein n=1 Tax=Nitratireductor indicus TaxID=721133 RepID=UPI0028765CC3|nr:hypothetical protein [Nitratireductor indicus]MDS1138731.1 hypothetical protein [Nitratireductor indicus]
MILSAEWKKALWDKFVMAVLKYSGRKLRPRKPLPQTVGVVGLAAISRLAGDFQHRVLHPDVDYIDRRQGEGGRLATIISQTMDFACSSAEQSANCLRPRPLLSLGRSGAP